MLSHYNASRGEGGGGGGVLAFCSHNEMALEWGDQMM